MRRPSTSAAMPDSASLRVSWCSISPIRSRAALGQRVEAAADDLVGLRIKLAERQILELLAHAVHAHAAGERRVDVERFLGDAAAPLRRHVVEGAHVVQAVGELDQKNANIVGNGEKKLAEVLGLLGFSRNQVELLQLGQAFHQVPDIRAEYLIDLRARGRRVLDRVVQQRRRDGGVVELEVGQNRRNFKRMREIRIARGALLLAVRLHGVDVGAVEQSFVGVRIVAADPLDQFVLPHHRRGRVRFLSAANDLRDQIKPTLERRAAPGRVLHARQIGLRACHKSKISRRFGAATRQRPKMVHEMDTARKSGPSLARPLPPMLLPILRRVPAALPAAPGLPGP